VLLLAWDRVFKIKDALGNKQYKPEDTRELFRELLNDVQNIHEELAEFINTSSWNRPSSFKNHIPIPSESEDECECDVPDWDDSQMKKISTFSNPLFDDSTFSDDESSHEEDIHEMSFKTYSNPLFDLDEEIISNEFNLIHNEDLESTLKNDRFDTEPYLLESLLNHDTLKSFPLKIDSLLAEFAGALIFLKSIPPGIDEADCGPEEDIHLVERLFDSNMEEINLAFTPDEPMPPSIKDDNYDSGRDIPILEELLDNYSLSLPINESYHFDIPSPYRPPAKPPDGNTGTLNIKMMGDVSDQKGLDALLPSAECPMIINGKNIPLLDVPLFHFYPP
nr:hypothetical protein [Tanacetum cinerariifolium]